MLRELRVGNLALVDDLVLPFGSGLTIITGETGAGKSLIAGAMELLTGGKAARDFIRQGEDLAYVEGVFDLEDQPDSAQLVREQGIRLAEDQILVLRREMRREGRGRVLINGLVSSLALLQELGPRLLAIQSQDQQRELSRSGFARDFLDQVLDLDEPRRAVATLLKEFTALQEELAGRRQEEEFARQQLEMWEYQLRELEGASLDPAEEADLAEKIALGRNSRALLEAAGQAREMLTQAEGNASELIGRAAAVLQPLTASSPRLTEVHSRLLDAQAHCEEAGSDLERFLDGLAVDPASLDEMEERLELYTDLCRKYRLDVAGLLDLQEDLAQRVQRQQSATRHISRLEEELSAAREKLQAAVVSLRKLRLKGAGPTALRARELIEPLALPEVELEFVLEPVASEDGPITIDGQACAVARHGSDQVHLLARTNRGEGFGPVGRIASGGEKSRLFLGLSVLSLEDRTRPLLLFDEIDAGLGMDNAVPVARLLARLARGGQVLCITHLPTVAAHGKRHLKVAKAAHGERTTLSVLELGPEDRVQEIRRLLGGEMSGRESAASQDDYARKLLASHGAAAGET
jgi:DNA repair protein RecN (Recombination protein N)